MKTIYLLLLIIVTPAISQKLWEIEVNPNDLLRDVMEIPNSDLLLFTYNTGKLEIRNSNDGSLIKNVTNPQGELGSYNISGLGNSYYFSERDEFEPGNEGKMINDTIFVYDLFSDQIINRISFDIEGFENKENIQTKKYRYSFTPDMTKLFGRIEYRFQQPIVENYKLYHSKYYFYVYDVIQRRVTYFEKCHETYTDEHGRNYSRGFYLDGYRSSPDSKYLILNGRDFDWENKSKNAAKMFNVELNEMSILMTNENTSSEKLGVLEIKYNRFLNSEKIISAGFSIYSFPEIILIKSINLFSEFGLFASLNSETKICDNNLFCRVGERKENSQNKYYYYHIFLNYDDKNIILNTKNLQTSLEFSRMYLIGDCQNLIVVKDFDNRDGIISCYDFQTLNVENINSGDDYFNKTENIINFNSQEFIGQSANIEIFNSAGIKVGNLHNGVLSRAIYNLQIPELSSGAYYLQCQLPNQNLNFNFVVVR